MCGAAGEQKDIFNTQNAFYKQLINQAQQIFGSSSKVFNDLVGAFAPIVAAGPDQKGFSLAEESALKSQAITNVGQAAAHAGQAVRQSRAAMGGGNVILPGGADIGANLSVANAGAQETANELTNINLQNYETGRQNFFRAAEGLAGAPSVFNPATSAAGAATGAGNAAAESANQIAQANNSWMSAVSGVLGGVAGGLTGGLMHMGTPKLGGTTPNYPPSPDQGYGS